MMPLFNKKFTYLYVLLLGSVVVEWGKVGVWQDVDPLALILLFKEVGVLLHKFAAVDVKVVGVLLEQLGLFAKFNLAMK